MRVPTLVFLALAVSSFAGPVAAQRVVLADFEDGIEGWWTNPWGGGVATVSASDDARFGDGALRVDYALDAEGKLRANLVGPYLPPDASWRDQPQGAVSLWYRFDGRPLDVTFSLTTQPDADGGELSFSRDLPAGDGWMRKVVYPRELWNRQRQELDLRNLGRVIVRGSEPVTLWLDHLTLLPAHRQVPLEPFVDDVRLLEYAPGRYEVEVDLPDGVAWSAAIELPGGGRDTAAGTTGSGDVYLPLTAPAPREGDGSLIVATPAGERRFRFAVLLPGEPRAVGWEGILPTPKQAQRHDGAWALPPAPAGTLTGAGAERCADELTSRLAEAFGLKAALTTSPGDGRLQTLRLGIDPPPLPAELPPEGYVLRITPAGAALAAGDDRGLFNGVQSLLQALEFATLPGQTPHAPAMEVVDWPSLAVRSASLVLPPTHWAHPNKPPVPLEAFLEFIDRTMVRRKYNQAVFQINTGMVFPSIPQIASPTAYTPDEMRRLVAFCRDHFIEPIPCVNSLGHASWLCIGRPDLAEDRIRAVNSRTGESEIRPDINTLCTRNPDTWPTLIGVYQDVIDIFQPTTFHIGLDEVRWQTLKTDPELRCERCAGTDKAETLGGWVTRLHDWLAEHGIATMMWTDMLTDQHNGGAPYFTHRALGELPRDIVMANWSARVAPLHTWELADLGFAVIKSNSEGVDRGRAPKLLGNMVGMWSKVPWCSESVGGENEFTHERLTHGAEYSWNLHPSLDDPKLSATAEFLAQTAAAEAVATLAPEPAAGRAVTPLAAPAGTQPLAGWPADAPDAVAVRDIEVPLWGGRALAPSEPLPVGRRVAAVYLAQTADGDAEALNAARDRLREPELWQGLPLGELVVTYADGAVERTPLRFGDDVRWRHQPAPAVAYGAAAVVHGGGENVWLRQWVNPRPDQAVASLAVETADLALTPRVLGAAVREVR